MADIPKLNYSFTDYQTTINAEHLNAFVDRINKLIDVVGGVTPSQVATPSITVNNGVVTITCSTTGATIRYTTDGSTPTSSSGNVYSAAFTPASGTTQIKAIAYKSGMTDSQVATQSYTPAVIDITNAILATTWEAGGIKHQDGGIQSAQSFDHSNYFDVSTYAGKVLNYSRIVRDSSTSSPIGLAFYDSSQQYISGQGLHHSAAENGWEDYDVEIPSNAKYIRMSWYNATGSGAEWHDDFYAKIKG